MLDIIVPQKWLPRQIEAAKLKAIEFRKSRYTSGCANLDNMIELGKAVILCDTHSRKFSPKRARYRLHPDPRMNRVNGCCDVCQAFGLHFLYLNGAQANEEEMKVAKFQRALEYGNLFRG
jgi:hypothetical protein